MYVYMNRFQREPLLNGVRMEPRLQILHDCHLSSQDERRQRIQDIQIQRCGTGATEKLGTSKSRDRFNACMCVKNIIHTYMYMHIFISVNRRELSTAAGDRLWQGCTLTADQVQRKIVQPEMLAAMQRKQLRAPRLQPLSRQQPPRTDPPDHPGTHQISWRGKVKDRWVRLPPLLG